MESGSTDLQGWRYRAMWHILGGMSDNVINAISSTERDARGQFKVGHTGMGGRPRGARSKLTTQFLDDLQTTWELYGKSALERCAIEEPAQFARIVAGLLPREAHVNV